MSEQKKVLLLEDNLGDAKLLQATLQEDGYKLFVFKHVFSLEEGVKALNEEVFDIIVTDLSLPDSEGMSAVITLHATSIIPIIVLSGSTDSQSGLMALRNGAQDYLVKGKITSDLFNRTVNYAIERHKIQFELEDNRKKLERANQELEHLNVHLTKLDALKSDFVSTISHELRTPLTVIRESVSIVHDGTTGEINAEQKDFLDTAKRNLDRLSRLINNVLDYQKLDAQKMEFIVAEQSINDLVSEVVHGFQILLKNKGLEVIINLQPDLPMILFDKDKIIQVVTNLISNAIKFTDKGSITLITEKLGLNAIKVSVKDNGLGIKETDMEKLFKSFSQISSGERQSGGTGLGLILCKKIIEGHRGKIGAESIFGQGSTFYFILPIQERRLL